MSKRYIGGLITKSPATPTGPAPNGSAPGIWTLDQANYWITQGVWPAPYPNFVEDVFSTYLYTGNGSTQTITNGINLSGQGGLVWIKCRSLAGENNVLLSQVSGSGSHYYWTFSDSTGGSSPSNSSDTYFLQQATGFRVGPDPFSQINGNGQTFASWTFRKAPKFFDVVTYTGDNVSGRAIPHNLGVAPGCMFIKPTNAAGSWIVYHRSTGATKYLVLESTSQEASSATIWGGANPTATQFTIGGSGAVNQTGTTYVAYLFAHDTSSTGIIQCGSFNNSSGSVAVTLGWEPQWLLMKNASAAGDWFIADNMRGMPVGGSDAYLLPNSSAAENSGNIIEPTATGFTTAGLPGSTNFLYIAIRRGPMKTPTLGTTVFLPSIQSESGGATVATSFPVDMFIDSSRALNSYNMSWFDRLRGNSAGYLRSPSTAAEGTLGTTPFGIIQNGVIPGMFSTSPVQWLFRRAPSFFDEVCYTGTGSARTINHNLGVAPELMIVKARTATGGGVNPSWAVYSQATGNTKALFLDQTSAGGTSINYWNNTTPTSSVFSTGAADATNASATPYVAYLFSSCPGVSKVGSYTGTGALQTVNCGFTTGARFVLIKRTDSTGDWYVWDSARGITSGNDPYLLLNSTAAEVTGTNYVDTDTTGFQVTAAAPAGINANGGSYIFLAIA